jgi:hypothetical protein
MKGRIVKGGAKNKKVTSLPEAIEGHVHTLRELAKLVHRVMTTMMAFELQIRSSIEQLANQHERTVRTSTELKDSLRQGKRGNAQSS